MVRFGYYHPQFVVGLLASGEAQEFEELDIALEDSFLKIFDSSQYERRSHATLKEFVDTYIQYKLAFQNTVTPSATIGIAINELERICTKIDLGRKLCRDPSEKEIDKASSQVGPIKEFMYRSLGWDVSKKIH